MEINIPKGMDPWDYAIQKYNVQLPLSPPVMPQPYLSFEMGILQTEADKRMGDMRAPYELAAKAAAEEKAINSSDGIRSALSGSARLASGVIGGISSQEMGPYGVPKGHLGPSSCENLFIGKDLLPLIDWIAPNRTAVEAYDKYLCINGYYMDGNTHNFGVNSLLERPIFSYVKMIDATINGDLGIYRKTIEGVFNKGIRFWRPTYATAIGIYDQAVLEGNKAPEV